MRWTPLLYRRYGCPLNFYFLVFKHFTFIYSTFPFSYNFLAMEYCHSQGIVHRDLKAENLLMDADFNLRIADFGFATLLCGKDGSGQLYTVLGTESYMAPEIHMRQSYSGPAVDLFACAVILFIIVSGSPPFIKADPQSDAHYKLLCINRSDAFWEAHERNKPKENGKSFYSDEFKNLMSAMFSLDPAVRLTLPEIKAHPWYNGPTLKLEELQAEFIERKKRVDMRIQKQRQAKKDQKLVARTQLNTLATGTFAGIKPFRGGLGEIETVNFTCTMFIILIIKGNGRLS